MVQEGTGVYAVYSKITDLVAETASVSVAIDQTIGIDDTVEEADVKDVAVVQPVDHINSITVTNKGFGVGIRSNTPLGAYPNSLFNPLATSPGGTRNQVGYGFRVTINANTPHAIENATITQKVFVLETDSFIRAPSVKLNFVVNSNNPLPPDGQALSVVAKDAAILKALWLNSDGDAGGSTTVTDGPLMDTGTGITTGAYAQFSKLDGSSLTYSDFPGKVVGDGADPTVLSALAYMFTFSVSAKAAGPMGNVITGKFKLAVSAISETTSVMTPPTALSPASTVTLSRWYINRTVGPMGAWAFNNNSGIWQPSLPFTWT